MTLTGAPELLGECPLPMKFYLPQIQIANGSSLVPNPSLRYEKEVANSLSHCTGPRELKFAKSENVRTYLLSNGILRREE